MTFQINISTFIKVSLLYFSVNLPTYSIEKTTVNWYKPDSPPGHIMSGPLAEQGYNDEVQKLFIEQLPEFKHHDITANYQRAVIEMKKSTGCIVGIFQTEKRAKHLHFSKVRQLVLSNGIIIPDHHYKNINNLLDDKGTISLEAFINQTKSSLVGGISNDRVYGEIIDQYINNGTNKLVKRSSNNVFTGLLTMLSLNRIDYTFGYPVELQYFLKNNIIEKQFHFIPIREMPEYLTSYTACSKSARGLKIIKSVNNYLRENRQSEAFYSIYKNWLDEESANRFVQQSNAFYLKNPDL
jgi:uncharacterized protein (TIGR02285 family)